MVLIPEDMKVPLSRRNTNKPENVRWLVRNLPVQNSEHPSFEVTSDSIARSLKQHMKSSENMYNGVSLSPAMRRAVEDHLYGVRNGFMPPVR